MGDVRPTCCEKANSCDAVTDRERQLWAILVRANEQQTIEIQRDIEACMVAFAVDVWARGELVKLGVNLDDVFAESDDEFLRRSKDVK